MKPAIMMAVVAAALFGMSAAGAAETHTGRMETCMHAALARHPGRVVTLEAEVEKGRAIYEFDIQGFDGKEWEIECDAKSGKLIEEEYEVANADDPAFKARAKVSLEDAKKTALARHPGDIFEIEYSIESDGTPSYELDIKTADGTEWEVEVDAVTGKILEEEREIYQIGAE